MAKRLWGETSWGKMILAEGNDLVIWSETTRILDGKIVTCFTHYKVNLRQPLELVKEAFRNLDLRL